MRLGEQVGLALSCLADVEVDEGLKMANEHQYSAVEILGDESFADQGVCGLWPWESKIWEHIKPSLAPFHFKAYHAPYVGLNYLTLNPVVRSTSIDQIRVAIDTAAEMGLSPVIVHPGEPRPDMNERVLDLLITTFLEEVAVYAEEKNIRVALETCEYFTNLATLQHYIAKVKSPYIGVCLDVSPVLVEANNLDTDKLNEFIREIRGRLFHCRLHGMVSEQAGRVNYERIGETLVKEGYQGAVIFQIVTDAIDSINESRDVIYKVG